MSQAYHKLRYGDRKPPPPGARALPRCQFPHLEFSGGEVYAKTVLS